MAINTLSVSFIRTHLQDHPKVHQLLTIILLWCWCGGNTQSQNLKKGKVIFQYTICRCVVRVMFGKIEHLWHILLDLWSKIKNYYDSGFQLNSVWLQEESVAAICTWHYFKIIDGSEIYLINISTHNQVDGMWAAANPQLIIKLCNVEFYPHI